MIDYLAVVAGGFGGAVEATQDESREYDVVGVCGLGLASALGGGVTRDVLLSRGTPLALVEVRYLLFAFAGVLLAVGCRAKVGLRGVTLLSIIDAAGLGLFAVAGSTRAYDAGLRIFPSVLLGAVTAAGGGVCRDILLGKTPAVYQRGTPYVLIALVASAAYFIARMLDAPVPIPSVVGFTVGFALRIVALKAGWQTRSIREITHRFREHEQTARRTTRDLS